MLGEFWHIVKCVLVLVKVLANKEKIVAFKKSLGIVETLIVGKLCWVVVH